MGLKELVIQIDVYIIEALVEPISYLSTGVIFKLLVLDRDMVERLHHEIGECIYIIVSYLVGNRDLSRVEIL